MEEIFGPIVTGTNYPPLLQEVVDATDDDGGIITYSILENSCSQNYSIENIMLMSLSGELIVTALDRELTPFCDLVVEATDGLQAQNVPVRITVIDRNDHTPYFVDLQQANVSNRTSPATFYTIRAFDDDIGRNAEVSFVLAGPESDRFVSLINMFFTKYYCIVLLHDVVQNLSFKAISDNKFTSREMRTN